MLNDKNLVPFSNRSESEARKTAERAAGNPARPAAAKKALKSLMNDLLSSGIVNDDIQHDCRHGLRSRPTYGAAVVAAMARQAALGGHQGVQCDSRPYRRGQPGERVKLQKKQAALQEKKLSGEEEQAPDDGFLVGAGRLCCGGLER